MKKSVEKFLKDIQIYCKNNILFLVFVLATTINGCLLRFLTVKNYFQLEPILADFAIALILGGIGYLFKNKNQFWYYLVVSIIVSAICMINSVYYTNYISFVSLSLIATSTQLGDVSDAVFENIMEIKDLCYLWQIFAVIFTQVMLRKKAKINRNSKKENRVHALNIMIIAFIIMGFFVSMLTSTDISRLGKQWNRESVVMKFGVYIYQINDAIASIQPQISPLFGYDSAFKEFREYYSEEKESQTNAYTNILKGKNIIMIHAESMQDWVLHASFNGQDVAPNLKRLSEEGLYFSNFYAQESVGTSSDTEFTLNTSLMPSTSGTVFMNYYDREYVTIPKLLKELGYYNFSMHGNKGAFWNRNIVHKNFGYDNFYYYTKDFEIDETIGLGLSDKSFFRQSVPKIQEISKNHQNFYGTMIMLTNHTPFSDIVKVSDYDVSFKGEYYNEETGETQMIERDFLEGRKLGNYVKSVHYADEAIGEFIEQLDQAGLLENTAIVIYGDHDAKLNKSEYNYYYNYDPYTDSIRSKEDPEYIDVDFYQYELNRKVPFIIWTKQSASNPTMNQEIKKVMGMYDVAPTLGNMLGFKNEYAQGNDIFSIEENVVIFPDGNWVTDKMYYNSQKESGKILIEGETIDKDYIEKYCELAETKIAISNDIIVYDLIKKTQEQTKLLEEAQN